MADAGFSKIRLKRDMQGKDRMISAEIEGE